MVKSKSAGSTSTEAPADPQPASEPTQGDASSSDSGSSSESDSSSDYSSEDSDAEFVTPSVDQAILRTIAKIQAKDPSIYEKGSNVYDDFEQSAQSGQPSGRSDKKKQEHKPMRMKDMQRLQLLGQLQQEQHEQPTPAQEEAALKAEMRAAFHQDNTSNHSDSGEDDGLLQVRQTLQPNEDNDEEMKSLIDSTLSKDDAFLRDFILKRGWVDKTKDALPTHEQIVGQDKEDVFEGPTGANALGPGFKPLQQDDDEADAEFENRAEAFENRYNFRFEESGADEVTSHTRQAESLRKADESRKSKREAKKERKAAEKASKANDINRLKAAKRQDILDKLKEQIQQISGKVAVDGVNLEGDFDEEQHQKMMQSMFDEDWYGQEGDGTEKPEWADDIDVAEYEEQEEGGGLPQDEEEAYDPTTVSNPKKKSKKERKKEQKEKEKAAKKEHAAAESDAHAVAGPSALTTSTAVDQTEKAFAALPEDQKARVQKELDEYYALDYEDMIENMPTRFKYTEVPAESYGLTAADVLNLTDKELNAYVSLKKLAPYRQDGSSNTKKKAQDKKLRDLKRATGQRGWGDALPQSRAKQVDLSKYSASSGDKKRKRDHESTLNGDGLSTEGAAGGGKKKRMGKKERQRAKSAAEPVE